jgi:hypothetical protein
MALLPSLFLSGSLGYYWIVTTYSEGQGCCWVSEANLWGTIATYSTIPAYILLIATYLWRQTRSLLEDLKLKDEVRVLQPSPSFLLVLCAVAASVAIAQYFGTLWHAHLLSNAWLDFSMIGSNLITWTLAAWLVAYRLSAGFAMFKLGRNYPIDLYNLSAVRPFGRMAILDLLFVMGIIALIPFQSLDFEIRWVNYKDALMFLVPVAFAMALLPMWGVRQAIIKAKTSKAEALRLLIKEADQTDPIQMEALLSHLDRITHLPAWPLDLRLLSRIALYVILPPIAWTAAAMVEMLIEQLIGVN